MRVATVLLAILFLVLQIQTSTSSKGRPVSKSNWSQWERTTTALNNHPYHSGDNHRREANRRFKKYVIPLLDKLSNDDEDVKYDWLRTYLDKNDPLDSKSEMVVASFIDIVKDMHETGSVDLQPPLTPMQVIDLKISLVAVIQRQMNFAEAENIKEGITTSVWRSAKRFLERLNPGWWYHGGKRGTSSYGISQEEWRRQWENMAEPWGTRHYKDEVIEPVSGKVQIYRLAETITKTAQQIAQNLGVESLYNSLVIQSRPYWVLPWTADTARCQLCLQRKQAIKTFNKLYGMEFREKIVVKNNYVADETRAQAIANRHNGDLDDFKNRQDTIRIFDDHYYNTGKSMAFDARMIRLRDEDGHKMYNTMYLQVDFMKDFHVPQGPGLKVKQDGEHIQIFGFHWAVWKMDPATRKYKLEKHYGSQLSVQDEKTTWTVIQHLDQLFQEQFFITSVQGVSKVFIAHDHASNFVSKHFGHFLFQQMVQRYRAFSSVTQVNWVPLMHNHGESNVDHMFGFFSKRLNMFTSHTKISSRTKLRNVLRDSASMSQTRRLKLGFSPLDYHCELLRNHARPPNAVPIMAWTGLQSTLHLRGVYRNRRLSHIFNHITPWVKLSPFKIWPPYWDDDVAFIPDSDHVYGTPVAQRFIKQSIPESPDDMGKIKNQYDTRKDWE